MDIKKKIKKISDTIKRHNELYYIKGVPEISDGAYDAIVAELKKLEKAHPEYAGERSPTGTVGAPIPEKFRKVEHVALMLSLESVNDEKGAYRFDQTCRKEAGEDVTYLCEPKLDGISIELVYERGVFLRGSTRGDGRTGEDVTQNLKTIENVPGTLKIKIPPKRIAVRGEVMMHIKDFNELNKEQAEAGREIFANPRNVVAGSMRQLDRRITAGRKLRVYCYGILELSGKMPATQKEALDLLTKLGFSVSPGVLGCASIEEAISYHHDLERKRDDLDYEIDGAVIKINDLKTQEKLGMRTTNPKWAVAYKFKPRREITRVEDIVVQVGRTGVLTPLALLQSVDISGVTVSRATLHNMDQIERLGIRIGDYVRVERAGDVIPYISEVVKEKRTGSEKSFRMPSKCPSCGTSLEKEDVFYRCPAGFACPAQVKESLTHYVSKDAVDIEGFSGKTAEQLFDRGLIRGLRDIYSLKKEDLLELEGWKEKKTDNLLKAVSAAKHVTLDRFIFALGIRNVGRHIAALLAGKFGSLERIMAAEEEELVEIKEIGPEIAGSIKEFFSSERNINEIKELRKRGVVIKEREKRAKGRFTGKKVVFTGTMEKMTRSEAREKVESAGGEVASGISSEVDMVVAGDQAGSKLAQAKKKGIEIISEEDFLEMIAG